MSKQAIKPAVVLVADRTLSADYKILFEGIFGTMQTTKVPEFMMRRLVAPNIGTDGDGSAKVVPLGLRKVETALLKYTSLASKDVCCTTPEGLPKVLGPWVKVVGVSSSDPLGNGMSNTTTTSFWEGELYSRYWTRKLLDRIAEAKERYGFKVVFGGAGAWQWKAYPEERNDCIDVVFDGYFEKQGPGLFENIINGTDVPDYVCESGTAAEAICPIENASALGIVELSRGCGRGCSFCSMARKPMKHLPIEKIVADIETNVSAGVRSVVSASEDFFRYGAEGVKPDFEKLTKLLAEMRRISGLSFMQIDHGNIASVLQLSDDELRQVRQLLTWEKKTDYLWVNLGAESASGSLVAANCRGKIAPFNPDDWEDMIRQAAEKMTQAGFFSVFSLILGLPGETEADVTRTLELVKHLEKQDAVIFPIFYEPIRTDEIAAGKRFGLPQMRTSHLELYRRCYEINFRRVPLLFWDNQRAGGVSWTKRALMRILGKTEVWAWRKKFNSIGRDLRSQGR